MVKISDITLQLWGWGWGILAFLYALDYMGLLTLGLGAYEGIIVLILAVTILLESLFEQGFRIRKVTHPMVIGTVVGVVGLIVAFILLITGGIPAPLMGMMAFVWIILGVFSIVEIYIE